MEHIKVDTMSLDYSSNDPLSLLEFRAQFKALCRSSNISLTFYGPRFLVYSQYKATPGFRV